MKKPDFFLPVLPLARLFRGKLLDRVQRAVAKGLPIFPQRLDPAAEPSAFRAWLDGLYATAWNVFSKPPFGGAEGGLEYLGRYSHRVAISNPRLVGLEEDRVRFRWKDYRADGQQKVTSLDGVEFVRRFFMHVLPSGFQRIRSFGLLANRHRSENLERCRQLLGAATSPTSAEAPAAEEPEPKESLEEEIERLTSLDPLRCPACGEGRLVIVDKLLSRAERLARAARAPPGGAR